MDGSTAKILPPTPGEIEAARKDLYEKLEESERQPFEEKRSADEVFKEMEAVMQSWRHPTGLDKSMARFSESSLNCCRASKTPALVR